MRAAFTAAAALAVLAASSAAHALEVKTAVSSQRVGVGESFHVQLVMMSDGQNGSAVGDVAGHLVSLSAHSSPQIDSCLISNRS